MGEIKMTPSPRTNNIGICRLVGYEERQTAGVTFASAASTYSIDLLEGLFVDFNRGDCFFDLAKNHIQMLIERLENRDTGACVASHAVRLT